MSGPDVDYESGMIVAGLVVGEDLADVVDRPLYLADVVDQPLYLIDMSGFLPFHY
jgi:hypothetical protein